MVLLQGPDLRELSQANGMLTFMTISVYEYRKRHELDFMMRI
jgi:hypothetical protein